MNRAKIKKYTDEILYDLQLGELLAEVDNDASGRRFLKAASKAAFLTDGFNQGQRFLKVLKHRIEAEGQELGLGELTRYWLGSRTVYGMSYLMLRSNT
jgi:hypothetical protein